jgi:ATP:ADP antiporter, AAA family
MFYKNSRVRILSANLAKSPFISIFSSQYPAISSSEKLNKILDYIWPIRREELSKFFLTTLLMFGILGIQNLIRALKDGIVNTMLGTETISFLKFWGVTPSSFLIAILYIKLVGVMKGENIFYFIISAFLCFFALFAFYIFPNYQILHLSPEKADYLVSSYPNLKWFIILLSSWSFSLFYIIAELWPSVVIALLFWQFVNKVTDVEQSKRFYPLFGLFSQTGLLLSGVFLTNLSHINAYIITKFSLDNTYNSVLTIQIVLSIVLLLGIMALVVFWILNNKILDRAKIENLEFNIRKKHSNLLESFKLILQSRYILLITTLLICYGLSINLVEGPWKAKATKIYTTPTEFTAFVGSYLTFTGVFTMSFVIIGSNIVRKLGWIVAAMITPVMVFITGGVFFLTVTFDKISMLLALVFMISDPAMIAIIIGAIQNILSKSSKYALFDATKEMSYVPLDHELKTKGKAAADMIGTKLGKSTSALLQSLIFILIPTASFSSITSYLMIIFSIICIIWVWAVIELNKEYKKAVKVGYAQT